MVTFSKYTNGSGIRLKMATALHNQDQGN